MLQICALVFGLHVIYQERPYFTVFSIDRFEVLAQKDVDMARVDPALLRDKSWNEPVLVMAEMPKDQRERDKLVEETLFEGKPDIQYRPELWQPYSEAAEEIFSKARPLAELQKKVPAVRAEVSFFSEKSVSGEHFVYLPIMGKQDVFTLILDSDTRLPAGIIDQDPWKLESESPPTQKAMAKLTG